jgi:BirA family biotin operon repressor/biotin-[acetyl-CoA-carboxylase] ligase
MPANKPFVISEIASLSVKYTLDKYFSGISVKWPNDIYHNDRKIAGILIENTIRRETISQSIIGIGINVNQTEFIGNAPNPISMAQIAGRSFDLMAVLEDLRLIFDKQSERVNALHFGSIHKDYLNSVYRREGYHKYCDVNGVFEAAIHDIEPAGFLVLRRTDNTFSRYAFKEVSFNLNKHNT